MAEFPESRSSLAERTLGWFVVWQLLYCAVANVASFLPPRCEGQSPSAARASLEIVDQVVRGYTRLTLHGQYWRLFPDFPKESTFPAVRIVDQTGSTVLARSRFEPIDPLRYIHWCPAADRLSNFEAYLDAYYLPWQTDDADAAVLQRQREARVRSASKPLLAYLRWRVREYQAEHPESQPASAVFIYRIYPTLPPGQAASLSQPLEREIVRWQLQSGPMVGHLPLEVYDPVQKTFVSLAEQP